MKIAAFQAPLLPAGSTDALELIGQRVRQCEAAGVQVLCCPEAILGGLADYAADPFAFALQAGSLDAALAPIASSSVTTIVGFTELAGGHLYNSAAVLHRGTVLGIYRKLHPAIRRSVYTPGAEIPVFRAGTLTFGIVICNDSNFPEPARRIAAQGATVLFVPTNNGLPLARAYAELPAEARAADITRATENQMWVVRADVAGTNGELVSHGSSGIVGPNGAVHEAVWERDLLIAELP